MERQLRKGKFVTHVRCTNPGCGSSDALAVYKQEDGSYNGTCFSCGHFERDIPGYSSIDPPRVERVSNGPSTTPGISTILTVESIAKCPLLPVLPRHITQATAEHYGVRTILNGYDGKTPVAICFPYYIYNSNNIYTLVGYKKRILEQKDFSFVGNAKDITLFGEQLYPSGGKRLYITEGEIDAMSLYQVLKTNSTIPGYIPCVVSLPHGVHNAANALANSSRFLDKFKEIYLVFDQDRQGKEAIDLVCSFLPLEKVRIVTFDLKDANEMLMQGRSQDLLWAALTGAKQYLPSGITTSKELLEKALKKAENGPPWPWPTMTRLTHGRRPGLYGFGAGVGIGKTEFFHELLHHIITQEHKPVGIFLLEEKPERTLQVLAGKSLNLPIHDPDCRYNPSDAARILHSFGDPDELVYLFDHKGSRDWQTIYSQCKYFAAVCGVRDIVIDPLTAIISKTENTDRALHEIMDDMSKLCYEPYNCRVYFSSHLNEPIRGQTSHEEGGAVLESQFAGSRAMIRYANYIFGLERNKQDPVPHKRNTITVVNRKDRDYGTATGQKFELLYNQGTGRLLEQ